MVILYNNAMHISESEFLRNALHHCFQHLRASCLETGMAAIPLVIPNLYSVKRIISWCSNVRRVYHLEQKLLHKNPLCLEVRWQRRQTHDHQFFAVV